MKAALYFRVSTEDQRDRQTIETQAGEVRRYCEQNGIAVYKAYADDGVSGTVPFEERPAGARLLADARAGHFQTVLVWKHDRIGRDPLVSLSARAQLKKSGVSVQSTTQGFEEDTPTGRLIVTILDGISGFERENIHERSIAGTNRCAREGVWLGGIVPYGYRVEGGGSVRLQLVEATEPLPGLTLSEADIVRLIYRLAHEERLSCYRIAEKLNALDLPPPSVSRGRKRTSGPRPGAVTGIWRESQVRCILKSTTYRGVHRYGKRSKKAREVIERPVPAIVDEATWALTQQAMRLNAHARDYEGRRPYLLRGLALCAHCGLRYSGCASGWKHRRYYVCPGQQHPGDVYGTKARRCPSRGIRADDVEAIIWDDIEGFLRNPGEVLAELAQQFQAEGSALHTLAAEEEKIGARISGKQQECDAVIALFRRGRISQAQLDRQLDDIEREEAGLKATLEESRARGRAAQAAQTHLRGAESLLAELRDRLEEPLTWEVKRRLVEALVKEIQVDGAGAEPALTVTYAFGRIKDCTQCRSASRPAPSTASPGRKPPPAARRRSA